MTEWSVAPSAELKQAIDAFDRSFLEGRLDEFSAFFADDAQLLIHEQETVIGKEAIRASFDLVFEGFDTSAYAPRHEIIDVHGDRAYVLASFDEVLRPKDGQPGIRIHGRAVHFWRRERDGAWRIVRLLTARSAPEELEG
ncbi:MAG: nuclear transport factor 2 family protein [Jiangellaceae bacterium]|nr:nuclear transport factor 2 family protein [Jiangellaceae bacterium]